MEQLRAQLKEALEAKTLSESERAAEILAENKDLENLASQLE